MATSRTLGRNLTAEKWESFQFRIRFVFYHGVQIPLPDASLYNPPECKVGIPIALIKQVCALLTTDFFNLIIREYEFSVRELTPIGINKIVSFEFICRVLGHLPVVPVFKHFLNASTNSGT